MTYKSYLIIGAYGEVRKCLHKETKALRAVKIINKKCLAEEEKLKEKLTKAGMTLVDSDQKAFAEIAKVAVMESLTPEQKALLEKIKN